MTVNSCIVADVNGPSTTFNALSVNGGSTVQVEFLTDSNDLEKKLSVYTQTKGFYEYYVSGPLNNQSDSFSWVLESDSIYQIEHLTLPQTKNIDVIALADCPNRIRKYAINSLPQNSNSVYWTVPNGGTIISGQGTLELIVSYAPTIISGQVKLVASNGCCSSTSISVVALAPCP